jgi:tetratricopeptide (TPR) repeat protein
MFSLIAFTALQGTMYTASAYSAADLARVNEHVSKGEMDDAVQLCRDILSDADSESALAKQAALALNNCGVKLDSMKRTEEALELIEESFEYRPEDINIALNMADLYKKLGNADESLDKLQDAVGIAEDNEAFQDRLSGIYYRLSMIYNEKKDYSEAIYNLEKIIDLEPGNFNAMYQKGRCYYDAGELEQALDSFKTAHQTALEKNSGSSAKNIDTWIKKIDKELEVVGDFSEDQTNHFRITFDCERRSEVVTKVLDICEEAFSVIGYKMNFYPQVQTRVTVYDMGQYYDATGLPAWSGGSAYGNSLIRLPLRDAAANDFRTRRVLFHEYTHLTFHYLTKGKTVPLWLNEGAAQYNSEDKPHEKAIENLQSFLKKGKYVDLKDIEGTWNGFTDPAHVNLVYTTSFLAFIYIVEDQGKYDDFLDMLDLYAQGMSTEQVFKEVLEVSYTEFRGNFKKWMLVHYGPANTE